MEDILVPIALFGTIALCVWAFVYFRFRSRQELQQTLRESMTHGQNLSPELLDELAKSIRPAPNDQRRGIIFVAVGLATVVLAFVVGGMEEVKAVGPLLGVSAFPFLIGAAYLWLWRMNRE